MPKKSKDFSETDMYPPIKAFFEGLGYSVNAEVKGCDVAMVKNDELVIVELKKNFNMTLLYQAVGRLNMTTQVYVVIPRPRRARRDADWQAMLFILQKVGVGLITIAMDSPTRAISILLQPPVSLSEKNSKIRKQVFREIDGRSADRNIGGSNKRKIMTAYREKNIRIAYVLSMLDAPASASHIRSEHECPMDTYSIMYRNSYKWFKATGDAKFTLSAAGKKMLAGGEFAEIVEFYKNYYEDKNNICNIGEDVV
jgi:hypothetical protein